jgi:hypothetical protein
LPGESAAFDVAMAFDGELNDSRGEENLIYEKMLFVSHNES